MGNANIKKYWLAALFGCAGAAFASPSGQGESSEAFVGFLIVMAVVAVAYAFVFLLRLVAGSKRLAPDERNAIEFTKYTTPIDRPSIER
jgi:hypothetical protein